MHRYTHSAYTTTPSAHTLQKKPHPGIEKFLPSNFEKKQPSAIRKKLLSNSQKISFPKAEKSPFRIREKSACLLHAENNLSFLERWPNYSMSVLQSITNHSA